MTPGELAALRDVQGYAAARRVSFSRHARERVAERCGGNVEQVVHALAHATTCRAVDGGKWKTTGPDLDGDELSAVVAIVDGLIVVTVF